jgi:hypothetical protein
MSAEIIDTAGGLITARITGKLTQPELAALQNAAGDLIQKLGKSRLLVVAESFEGWQRGGDWGDLTFQMKHDEQIERMAIVCEKKWEDLALIFASKGLRKFPVEYFEPAEIATARAWLAEKTSQS